MDDLTDPGRTFRRGTRDRLAGTLRFLAAGLLIVACGAAVQPGAGAASSATAVPQLPAVVDMPVVPPPEPEPERRLVWSDEFDGGLGAAPDRDKWTASVGGTGWGNSELQYYSDRRANAQLDGSGNLVITALADGRGLTCWYGPCRYTSARLTTHLKFSRTYGRFEARIKIPGGRGVWPAFWLLGEDIDEVGYPQSGEIDVMENVGSDPHTTISALHGPMKTLVRAHEFGQPVADEFHVFAVDWTPSELLFSVDGKTFWTQPRLAQGWVFDHPFHIVLNVAIGGTAGEPGDTTFPRHMLVDYVRVFSISGT